MSFSGILMGHTIGLDEHSEPDQHLLADPVAELDDEEAEVSGKIIYRASFEQLSKSHVQCDTVIWVLISLLLVLAWGVGIIMLLYLPVRRFVLRKDISSRKLYVTPSEIVYKVARPAFLPFLGVTKIQRRIPLPLVIDIIIEQGCLQSVYGIHTFRVENVAYGKAASVDELQVQGVSNPGLLRKVIMTEAARSIQEVGRSWKSMLYTGEWESTPAHVRSLTEVPAVSRPEASSWKVLASQRYPLPEAGGIIHNDIVLHKLEEVNLSVKRIESLIGRSQALPETS